MLAHQIGISSRYILTFGSAIVRECGLRGGVFAAVDFDAKYETLAIVPLRSHTTGVLPIRDFDGRICVDLSSFGTKYNIPTGLWSAKWNSDAVALICTK